MKDDYDLSELQQIEVRGLRYNVMPRYLHHYQDEDYERFSLDILSHLIEDGSTVIDIGAHYGIYSLLASKKAAQVYAFEPVPENHAVLTRNISSNGIKNIQTYNAAVSDEEGTARFNVPWASDSAGFYKHPNAETIREIEVAMKVIDNTVDARDVSLVKIDTEGHELHVLEGMRQTLANNPRIKLLIEFNPECLISAGAEPLDLVKKIDELGFDSFALHEDSREVVTIDEQTTMEAILKGKKYLNLLCLRKGHWINPVIYLHSASVNGGAELCAYELVRGLTELYDDTFVLPYVVLPAEGPVIERYRELPVGMKIVYSRGWIEGDKLSPEELRQKHALNAGAVRSFASVYEDFKPRIAITQTLAMPWMAPIAKLYNVPHIWYIHEFGDTDHGFSFDYGYQQSLEFIDQHAKLVVANSKAVAKHVGRYINPKKIQTLYYNVFAPATSKDLPAVFKKDGLRLVIAGRVMPSKGQLEAVQALKLLNDRGVKAQLLIMGAVGSKPYMHEIEKYIRDHSLEKQVVILPHQSQPGDYVKQADIYLMCSKNEAFGRVTVEAMLLGKPVVGSNSGGTLDIVTDGADGYLYTPGDIEQLADAIQKLGADKKTLQRFAKAAKEHAEKRFNNDYYRDSLHLFQKLEAEPKVSSDLMRDLLAGTAELDRREHQERRQLEEQHRAEIAHFSDKYNEVYAAYDEASAQLAQLHDKKLVRLSIGVDRRARKAVHRNKRKQS